MPIIDIDVLCIGYACYDLVFGIDSHLAPDEKRVATSFHNCGGGPAANAAVTVSRLGQKAAFWGYLGHDIFGQRHLEEFQAEGVDTRFIERGENPTPISAVMIKPNGDRALVTYGGSTPTLSPGSVDLDDCRPKVILFDGHQPDISIPYAKWAAKNGVPMVLDAGSVHRGTLGLIETVDYVVASEKFARDFTNKTDTRKALGLLADKTPNSIITLGAGGLVWQRKGEKGNLPAFPVEAVDTTGAGDTFHGAFAAGLAEGRDWNNLLKFASAAAALCCLKAGARLGIPQRNQVETFLDGNEFNP
jgi:sulfofructose kinase